MGARQRHDPPLDGGNIGLHRLAFRQLDDGLGQRQGILGAVIDLAGEEKLALFRLLAIGDVDGDAADLRDMAVTLGRGGRRKAPAPLAVGAAQPEFGLHRARLLEQLEEFLLQPRPVLRIDQRLQAQGVDAKARRIDVADAVLALVPMRLPACEVPVPGSHLAGDQRQAAAFLAGAQPGGGAFELARAIGDTVLQLAVQRLQLPGLAMKLGEDLDLGEKNLRHHRHRHIVDRAHLVAAKQVLVREADGRDEDDRRVLEARMLADHGGKLEAVHVRHAHIHQDDGDVGAQELVESLVRGGGLQEVLAEIGENDLIAQELRRLVVDQQDVDLAVVLVLVRHPDLNSAVQPHPQGR